MSRKKLPTGIATFARIRRGDYYYVDKTGYAMQVADGATCFLSRPRRFGKSLFIDTLAEMFAGNKALFEGLACYDEWDWDTVHPVVRLGFAEGSLTSRAELDERIVAQLQSNAVRLGLGPMPGYRIPDLFIWLIQEAEQVHGQAVVVLVDEYDKPIIDNLADTAVAEQMRDGLRNVYSVLKGQDAHLRFVMLTGVSKFSKVSLFSGLNNLDDITLDPPYSAICGYTEEDLDTVFAPELEGLDRKLVREWYNGYNWDGEAVYNPYDLLLLFKKRQFKPYWYETATPKFLVDTLTSRQFYLPGLQTITADDTVLSAFDVGDMSTEALLFQTGYLTIGDTYEVLGAPRYQLRFPNREVRASLTGALLAACSPDPTAARTLADRLPRFLQAGDLAGVEDVVKEHFASIPHDWHRSNKIAQVEGYYSSVFYTLFASVGLDTIAEDTSSRGRLDLAVRHAGQVFLFELKVVDAPTGAALAQIKDKAYAAKYLAKGVPVHLVGVEFSRTERNIVAWDTETITPG
ncbi:MAG: ATP-binding protein [Micrococcales bacterium]|nr:ATP-binding protein [Micrococcales bacterium]MCL2667262.1 ATP-binding protein [Micrococcales bacterium]